MSAATRKVIVTSRHGLHVRPCVAIVNTVAGRQANVTIHTDRQSVAAADLMGLLSLGASQGTELTLTATGPEAEEVLDALTGLFQGQFGVAYSG